MIEIGPEAEQALVVHLGRLQACIDRLIGQDLAEPYLGLSGNKEHLATTRKKILDLMQAELDCVCDRTVPYSPVGDTEGAEWMLRQLRFQ
jgi:hypothetical protein